MTGVQMLLKQLGLNLDPQEIVAAFENIKEMIPLFAKHATETMSAIDTRLTAIERQNAEILRILAIVLSAIHDSKDPHTLPAGQGLATMGYQDVSISRTAV